MHAYQPFAKFLRENHLEDFTRESLRRIKELDIPLLRLFKDMSDEDLYKISLKSNEELLTDFEKGDALKRITQSLQAWEEDKLEYGIRQEDIRPDDFILTYAAQKQSLVSFLPQYTRDVEQATQIVLELLEIYMDAKRMAFGVLFRIRIRIEEQLRHSHEELMKLNEDLEQFTYLASHDMKEPLRMVSNYTQLLQHDYGDKLDANGREYIKFAVDGVHRMRDMINYLLNYARVSKGDIRFEAVDMNQIMLDVKSLLQPTIDERDAEIIYDNLPEVSGDRVQMTQLMQNLVSNAIKFTETRPRVEIKAEKQENGMWQFAVSDNGIGIPDVYAKKIFVLFQRLHDREKFMGSGIGLAICKRIVERHGGTIWFESGQGKGTTFYFTLRGVG
jgi:signal transduction histidine kinase